MTREREIIEDAARQFAYWSDGVGGLTTGGLSTLEEIFDYLGWDDPQPIPELRCDESGCTRQATTGWPTRPGGTGPNGGYRRTCFDHNQSLNPKFRGESPGGERAAMSLYDVIEVCDDGTERTIAEDKDERNAEAIRDMAVIRRGVEHSFFTIRPHPTQDMEESQR